MSRGADLFPSTPRMSYEVIYKDQTRYRLTFAGFLAVRLMSFEYAGKHYGYHGHKLERIVRCLTAKGGPKLQKGIPAIESTAQLVEWGKAHYDWRLLEQGASTPTEEE